MQHENKKPAGAVISPEQQKSAQYYIDNALVKDAGLPYMQCIADADINALINAPFKYGIKRIGGIANLLLARCQNRPELDGEETGAAAEINPCVDNPFCLWGIDSTLHRGAFVIIRGLTPPIISAKMQSLKLGAVLGTRMDNKQKPINRFGGWGSNAFLSASVQLRYKNELEKRIAAIKHFSLNCMDMINSGELSMEDGMRRAAENKEMLPKLESLMSGDGDIDFDLQDEILSHLGIEIGGGLVNRVVDRKEIVGDVNKLINALADDGQFFRVWTAADSDKWADDNADFYDGGGRRGRRAGTDAAFSVGADNAPPPDADNNAPPPDADNNAPPGIEG